jgi:hypothetical protein
MMMTRSQTPDWFFYPAWVTLHIISVLLGLAVYWALISPIKSIAGDYLVIAGQAHITEDFLLPYIFWPTLALANGLGQYYLLRRYLPGIGWWIGATALGWLLALFGAQSLYRATVATTVDVNAMLFELVKILLTGGVIGLAQWLLLRRRVPHAAWWILANVLGWGVSAVFSSWLDLWVLAAPALATVIAWWLLLDQWPRREARHSAARL